MYAIELVLALLVAVAALATLAHRLGIPYPIVLVLGGLLIGLVPGLPDVQLAPDLVFLLFLPPLLYISAFYTSVRDFRAQARPILSLAIGLVVATTVVVAAVVHAAVPGLDWAVAFTLGAIVSPPDAVAATAILRRLPVPRGIVTVLEGESLLNDAAGLVAFRVAVAAAVTGTFSAPQAVGGFVLVGVGGVAVGLAVGWIVARLRRPLHDPPVEITISLLTPFAAYLPAEVVGVSGVLATVACGLYLGRQAPSLMEADTRVQGRAVWETLVFLLDGLVFILIGLQLRSIVMRLADRPLLGLVALALLVCGSVVVVRFVWVFVTDWLAHPRRSRADSRTAWREDVVISWAGMRGVVSLAAALALPFTTASGAQFQERDLLIFLTICVILVTLVGQGLTFPWVLRALRLHGDGAEEQEEASAREVATQAARDRIEALAADWPDHLPLIDTLRAQYAHRASHFDDRGSATDGQGSPADSGARLRAASAAEQELIEHRAIRHAVIEAEHDAIVDLRDRDVISDDVLRRIERDLDLEELRMEA
jgi:monovalent cation/hydrogen antiporter